MKKIVAFLILVVLLVLATESKFFSKRDSRDQQGQLILTGSSTVAPLAVELGKQFESLHPSVRVDVQTGGSSRGIADARQGLCDIGMVSRSLKTTESDLMAYTVARDGICLIVHASNPIEQLSQEQIVAIYKGQINDWSEVGGLEAPVTVVNKAEGRSTLELFLKYFKFKNTEIQADIIIGDNEQGVKTVEGNPQAIGYVSIGTAEYGASHGVPIKLLPMKGVAASIENVARGVYPLSRSLNFVVSQTPSGLVKDFLDFIQSSEVHHLIRRQYFVPYVPQ